MFNERLDVARNLTLDILDVLFESSHYLQLAKLVNIIQAFLYLLFLAGLKDQINFSRHSYQLQGLPSKVADKHVSDLGQENLRVHPLAAKGDIWWRRLGTHLCIL